ncbi:hypothetical protein AYL99_09771 [Fonsecaea erecta]|uniref:VWFA domain-containing protein n=1 Tax=Fonsecaea erecta TaxID=1367422 RepID=A0A178Z768_9EURO|nr:hypothetical protein AYL99_09771 [Fonsecaea erecta]OAP55620.1 hypothetical protein AYL99_09771 [Fonsecaea erecta]
MPSPFGLEQRLCGCWIPVKNNVVERKYLPQVELSSHTHIVQAMSRTKLKQLFVNNEDHNLNDVCYTFPLYDGVSVVSFTCTVGSKTIVGVVKEKQQAKAEYNEAVARGKTAGLFEQLYEASDVFTTSVGNIPAKEMFCVEIEYLGELKHDAETNGTRFTIPTTIAPRYGSLSSDSADAISRASVGRARIAIRVDVRLPTGGIVQGMQSPSHPIAVTMGRTSAMSQDTYKSNHASATLTLGTTRLDKDFVLIVLAKDAEIPCALLETRSSIPLQRALMTTLVPKFSLPNISPEIVFIIDRSGSMAGKMELVVSAMKIFLKSLPLGVKFNICSFGSSYSFLFDKSVTYDQSNLKMALSHLETFDASYGGTEMLEPIKRAVANRFQDLPLEVLVLTDGEIWNQTALFAFVKETSNARFFSLGIGHDASTALVEGIARAGNGFAQFVAPDEKMDKRVVRMLKGALTPHVSDYTLEVKFSGEHAGSEDDDFEIVDRENDQVENDVVPDAQKAESKEPISLFDPNAAEEPTNPPAGRYDNLPAVRTPKTVQAPHKIPALFPFNRTTVYLMLGPDTSHKTPKSVVLNGTSAYGPLKLEIPIEDIGAGESIHQMAAKKAMLELEEGRGWIDEARNSDGQLLKTVHEGKWDLIVEREAVRLGVNYQVGGKWCSFLAVESSGAAPNFVPKSARYGYEGDGTAMRFSDVRPSSIPQAAFPAPPKARAPNSGLFTLGGPPPAPPQAPSPGFFGSSFGSRGGGALSANFARAPVIAKRHRGGFRTSGSGAGSSLAKKDLRGEADDRKEVVDISKLGGVEKMHRIIDLVEFDGSWSASKDLLSILGLDHSEFNAIKAANNTLEVSVIATALAVAWLNEHVLSEKDVWEMVADKAMEWLATRFGGEHDAQLTVEAFQRVF